MLQALSNAWTAVDKKDNPRSFMSVRGASWRRTTWLSRNATISGAVALGRAAVSTYRVRCSIARIIQLFWDVDVGNGPKRSTPTTSKGKRGGAMGWSSPEGDDVGRSRRWHRWQLLTYLNMVAYIPGQKNRCRTLVQVFRNPRWPAVGSSCRCCNTSCRRC